MSRLEHSPVESSKVIADGASRKPRPFVTSDNAGLLPRARLTDAQAQRVNSLRPTAGGCSR